MPNWVKNLVKFETSEERMNEIAEFLCEKKVDGTTRVFSLNKIVPMPEELNLPKSNALSAKKESWGEVMAQETEENYKKYGYHDWYDWRCAKWGCKWNTSEDERTDTFTYIFETPWAAPTEALLELSRMYPDVKVKLTYADEDLGYNVGRITFGDGHMEWEYIEQGRKEAWDIALDLWDCACDYVWVEEVRGYRPIDN